MRIRLSIVNNNNRYINNGIIMIIIISIIRYVYAYADLTNVFSLDLDRRFFLFLFIDPLSLYINIITVD